MKRRNSLTGRFHGGCKMAEEDIAFLKSPEARGPRLELDYAKAEHVMYNLGVERSIVVFGSARIKEPKRAKEELLKIEQKIKKGDKSKETEIEYKKAKRALKMSRYYEDARELGRLVGRCGDGPNDNRLLLKTGGGPGIMEAANRGASEVGSNSIGLNIKLPHEQFPNRYITPKLCFEFHYFNIRKLHFVMRADALVVYPGGFGTLDELFEIITLVQTDKKSEIPIVLVGKKYWHNLINWDMLVEEGMINQNDLEIFTFAENATEAWNYIVQWHTKRKTTLYKLYKKDKKKIKRLKHH